MKIKDLMMGDWIQSPITPKPLKVAQINWDYSEDEKIRKAISIYLDWLDGRKDCAPRGEYSIRDMVVWLEKQGKQKDFEPKVEPKFKVGDWITNGEDTWLIDNVCFNMYDVVSLDGHSKVDDTISHVDEHFHLWTIEDAKDGDVLNSPSHRLIWIYKDNEHYHACVNMNYVTENVATDGLISIPNDACPATKDEQTILFARMKESGYEWDAEKKELKKIEQKPNYCHHEVDLSGCSEEYRKAYYDGWNNCNLQWQHWLDDNHINVGERFDYQHATIINKDFAPKVDLGKESELIANGIMISVQANKYGTNIYNTERNDFNHHHLQMAAREGIELGLKAQKE